MTIIIKCRNIEKLEQHIPVKGTWIIEGDRDESSTSDVEEMIKNWINVNYPIEILVYREDGRKIRDELPCQGIFLAIRK